VLQINRLRISGFKSFADTVEMQIEPGLTGLVGPNGCGKSNVIEALRWVMGETSAKQIRGVEMDDVIFAGSSGRPSRSVAEVVVEMENGGPGVALSAGIDAEDICISRRIERHRGSVFRVNGQEVRARDVHILFADSATGARSAALVTQGQVAQLIAAKPAERRSLLEEAAGTVGLQGRRHEADVRLRAAEENLRRLEDVLATLDGQRQHLEKQVRQAHRFEKISAKIRGLEISIFDSKRRLAQEAIEEAGARLRAVEHDLAQTNNDARSASSLHAEAQKSLPTLRRAHDDAVAVVQRLHSERDLLEHEAQRALHASDAAQRLLDQIAADLARERSLGTDALAALDALSAEKERLECGRAGEDSTLCAARMTLEEATARADALDAEVLTRAQHVAAERERRTALDRSRIRRANDVRRLAMHREELERQQRAAATEAEQMPNVQAAQLNVEAAESLVKTTGPALQEAEAERARLAKQEVHATAVLRAAESAFVRLEAEKEALRDVLGAGSVAPSKTLLDGLSSPPGLELALAAAVGAELFSDGDESALLRWRTLPPYADRAPLPDSAAPLIDMVSGPDFLARRLGQTALLDEAQAGECLQPMLLPGQRLVDRRGALWCWDGVVRSADAEMPASVHMRRRARLAEVKSLSAAAGESRDLAATQHLGLSRALADVTAKEAHLRTAHRQAEDTLARARKSLAEAVNGRTRIESRIVVLSDTQAALEQEYAAAFADALTLDTEFAQLGENITNQQGLHDLQNELSEARGVQNEARERVEANVRAVAGRIARLNAIEADIVSWSNRLKIIERQTQELEHRRVAISKEAASFTALSVELVQRRATISNMISHAEAALLLARNELAAGEAAVANAEQMLRTIERTVAAARERLVRAEAQRDKAEEAARAIHSTGEHHRDGDPDCSTERAPQPMSSADLPAAEQQLLDLRRQRDVMGPVNLRAEQEAKLIDTQIADLRLQHDDLLHAVEKLRRAVGELEREGRERLRDAFAAIHQHFQDLFCRLFGGGSARLSLIDTDDQLATGIEIMASPPGKKLQLMSLLSGGEQTLTALALRFALFLVRPAPICILDEVDAALDDANVDRFCTLLDDVSRCGTRFIIVTHHRLTMARMHRLFGVTMPEQGVSRLVSVDFVRTPLPGHMA
jgi:chromosome segregation protein